LLLLLVLLLLALVLLQSCWLQAGLPQLLALPAAAGRLTWKQTKLPQQQLLLP
jgi:hypothetical protein